MKKNKYFEPEKPNYALLAGRTFGKRSEYYLYKALEEVFKKKDNEEQSDEASDEA